MTATSQTKRPIGVLHVHGSDLYWETYARDTIYRSKDDGETWTVGPWADDPALGWDIPAGAVCEDPSYPEPQLYVAAPGGAYRCESERGLSYEP